MKGAHVKAFPGHLYVHTVRPCYLFFIGCCRISLLSVSPGLNARRTRFSDSEGRTGCSEEHTGHSESRTGHSEGHTGHSEGRTRHCEGYTGRSEGRTGHSVGKSGEK